MKADVEAIRGENLEMNCTVLAEGGLIFKECKRKNGFRNLDPLSVKKQAVLSMHGTIECI